VLLFLVVTCESVAADNACPMRLGLGNSGGMVEDQVELGIFRKLCVDKHNADVDHTYYVQYVMLFCLH
jgi:hypothetical protein